MKKNINNEELQSRREFFKKAAKGALPILGGIVLANVPSVLKASESCTCAVGCQNTCYGRCSGTCDGGCKGTCSWSCGQNCTKSSR